MKHWKPDLWNLLHQHLNNIIWNNLGQSPLMSLMSKCQQTWITFPAFKHFVKWLNPNKCRWLSCILQSAKAVIFPRKLYFNLKMDNFPSFQTFCQVAQPQ